MKYQPIRRFTVLRYRPGKWVLWDREESSDECPVYRTRAIARHFARMEEAAIRAMGRVKSHHLRDAAKVMRNDLTGAGHDPY